MKLNKLQWNGIGVCSLNIPQEYIRELGWQKGDYISVVLDGKTLTLKLGIKDH